MDVGLFGHAQAGVDGRWRGAPVFVQLQADHAGMDLPAWTCWCSAWGWLALPLPRKPRFIGKASAALSIMAMLSGPGVQVVAKVPVAGPVPPPIMVVTPLLSASSICCGQ